MKTLIAALTFASMALAGGPGFADGMMSCDDANVMNTEEGMSEFTDENSMKMAMRKSTWPRWP